MGWGWVRIGPLAYHCFSLILAFKMAACFPAASPEDSKASFNLDSWISSREGLRRRDSKVGYRNGYFGDSGDE